MASSRKASKAALSCASSSARRRASSGSGAADGGGGGIPSGNWRRNFCIHWLSVRSVFALDERRLLPQATHFILSPPFRFKEPWVPQFGQGIFARKVMKVRRKSCAVGLGGAGFSLSHHF